MTFATQANMKLAVCPPPPAGLLVCLRAYAIDDVVAAKTNFCRPNGNTRRPNFIYDNFVILYFTLRPPKMNVFCRSGE